MDLSVIRTTAKLSLSGLAIAALSLSAPASAVTAGQAATAGLGYLSSQQQADGQISGFTGINAWAGLAYIAASQGLDTVKTSGGQSLRAYLSAHPPAAGASATEWERAILVITADNQNPYSFGGINYVEGLRSKHSAGQIGSATAVNDDAYGVLALVAANVPSSDPALVDATKFLLANQRSDGGFSYTTDASVGSDVDDTAAALAALAAAQDANVNAAGLTSALTQAQTYLLSKQNADGGFLSDPAWGTASNVSSTGVALIALNSLGLGSSAQALQAQAYLISTQQPDGSFPYQLPVAAGQTGDTFNSAYAVAALAGGTWPQVVYDGPVPSPSPRVSPSPSPSPNPGSVLGASTGDSGGATPDTLPAVGQLGNLILFGLAALIAVGSGLILYRRQKHSEV
jgi:prenyltransferase beta subunit